jgi:hypothetical protein
MQNCQVPRKPTIITFQANLSTTLFHFSKISCSSSTPGTKRTAYYTAEINNVKRLALIFNQSNPGFLPFSLKFYFLPTAITLYTKNYYFVNKLRKLFIAVATIIISTMLMMCVNYQSQKIMIVYRYLYEYILVGNFAILCPEL